MANANNFDMSTLTHAFESTLLGTNSLKISVFTGTSPTVNVREWLEDYDAVADALQWDNDEKTRRLRTYLAGPAKDWFRMTIAGGNQTWDAIKTAMETQFLPSDYTSYIRNELLTRKQKLFEDTHNYIMTITKYCKSLDPNMTDTAIIEYVYRGMLPQIKERLMLIQSDTVLKLIENAKLVERSLKCGSQEPDAIARSCAVMSEQPKNYRPASPRPENDAVLKAISSLNETIRTCIPRGDRGRGRSPYRGNYRGRGYFRRQNLSRSPSGSPRCFRCQQFGHMQYACPQQASNNQFRRRELSPFPRQIITRQVRFQSPTRDMPPRLALPGPEYINAVQPNAGNLIFANVLANGITLKALVDCGACVTVIPKNIALTLNSNMCPYDGPIIRVANGGNFKTLGEIDVTITLKIGRDSTTVSLTAVIVESLPFQMILGNDFTGPGNIIIDVAQQRIFLKPKENNNEEQYRELHCNENVTLPGRSSMVTSVIASNHNTLIDSCYITYPNNTLYQKTRLCIPNSIIKTTTGEGLIALTNFSDKPVKLSRGATIGYLEQLPQEQQSVELFAVINDNAEPQLSETMQRNTSSKNEGCAKLNLNSGEVSCGSQLTVFEKEQLISLLESYASVFAFDKTSIGRSTKFQHRINVMDNQPISAPPYRLSPEKRTKCDELVSDMLRQNIIRPSESPWSSPIVIVPKKDGGLRFCVDYRALNAVTKRDVYPLPNVQDSLDALSGSNYFTTLDMNQGYWQIGIADEDKEKTAFTTGQGLYEFEVMPFGLTNAPATFQRTMDVVLSGLKWTVCLVYLDDIVVFSQGFDQHLRRLQAVLDRILKAGLSLNPKKCYFAFNNIKYLGHIVDQFGQRPDPDKIRAVKEFPTPTCLRDVRSFVALGSYYRKFVPNYSLIAEPLSRLTRKDCSFQWNDEQETAFNRIKELLTTAPILSHFDPKLPTEVRVDASGYGLGACILQENNGWRPVAFASRLLNKAERNYSITEKECLAMVFGLERFRQYLEGLLFSIVTDHCALCWLATKKKLPPRLARWALMLQDFDYTVKYKSGKTHKDVDCLSRYPVENESEENKDEKMFAFHITSEELRDAQTIDDGIQNIIKLLDNNEELRDAFSLKNGILYRNTKDGLRVFVPKNKRLEICYSLHDDPSAGHIGQKGTLTKIRERFWWPKMSSFVINYVKSCEDCQHRKQPRQQKAGQLQPITVKFPFHQVGIDILGPLPASNGKRYIVVCTDYFTKWAETRALTAANAKQTAKFFVEQILCRHGAPDIILSDRGTNFLAQMVEEIFTLSGTKHVTTTSYHPQTNGLTERVNGILTEMLSMYVNDSHSDWSIYLPLITFAYNTVAKNSTSFSPFFLLYGRQARLPCDLNMGTIPDTFSSTHEYAEKMAEKWPQIREKVLSLIKSAQAKYKFNFDKNRRNVEYNLGDLVMLYTPVRIPGLAEKFLHRFFGPYKVVEKLSNLNYRLQMNGKKDDIVHVSRLKPFTGREVLEDEEGDELDDIVEDNIKRATKATPNEIFIQDTPIDTTLPTLTRFAPKLTEMSEKNIATPKTMVIPPPPPLIKIGSKSPTSPTPHSTPITWHTPPANVTPTYVPSPRPKVPEKKSNRGTTSRNVDAKQAVLRRSTRSTKGQPPNRFMFTVFLFCVTLEFVNGLTHSVTPLLWRQSEKKAIVGSEFVRASFQYMSPCEMFGNLPQLTNHNSKVFEHWCEHLFRESFTDIATSFCDRDEIDLKISHREKRVAVMAVVVGAAVVSGFVGVGFGAANRVAISRIDSDLGDLKERHKIVRNVLKSMEKQLEHQANISKDHEQRLDIIEAIIPRATVTVALIASRLETTRVSLIEIRRRWKRGEVSPLLFNHFNFTFPCVDKCPESMIKPLKCSFDPREQRITFDLMSPVVDSRLHFLDSDAFTLFRKDRGSDVICEVKYEGPKHVLYFDDNSTRCPFSEINFGTQNIILTPDSHLCDKRRESNAMSDFWRDRKCSEISKINAEDVIQVKQVGNLNYIYCPFFNISYLNVRAPCPLYVFTLPYNVSFKAGQLHYFVNKRTLTSNFNVVPAWVSAVNSYLLPHHTASKFYPFETEILRNLNELEMTKTMTDDVWLYTALGLMIALGVISLFALYRLLRKAYHWLQKRPTGALFRQKRKRNEEIEMTAIESERCELAKAIARELESHRSTTPKSLPLIH